MRRKFLSLFFSLIVILTNTEASGFRLTFPDFLTFPTFSYSKKGITYCDTINHWCNYAAERLHNDGIFTGINIGGNYYFMPDEYITRGEFLLYLNAILKKESINSVTLPFADTHLIPKWQLPTVRAMYENGIINGNTEKGKLFFNHDEKISRLDCAIILNNVLSLKNDLQSTDYYDNYLIPQYAVTAVKNVSDYGLMQGFEDNSFRPYIKINRAMMSEILCKVKDYTQR